MGNKFQNFITKTFTLPVITGIIIGAVAGYFYYYEIGCSTNSCPITSNPLRMIGVGAIVGYFVGDIFSQEKKNDKN